MEGDGRPPGRKFWTCKDVAEWIKANTTNREDTPEEAAIWWCCYRDTAALIDDTVRHVAQALIGGTPPYTEQTVTNELQNWIDEEGNFGDDADQEAVDREIEEDLRSFFNIRR